MAKSKRPPLVAEIGRLLVEYPAKDWRALADGLKDRSLIAEIATAVDEAIALVEKKKEKTKAKRLPPRENELARVAREDKPKAEILSALKSRLIDKDNSVTLAYIRGFASSLGMKEDLGGHREQAVNQIIRYLSARTTVEIEAALRTLVPVEQSPDQEFDRWVDLILGGEASTRRQKRPGAAD